MSHAHPTPDRLLSAGRRVLARFGSRALDHVPDDAFIDWELLWDELRGDFTTAACPAVPAFAELSAPAREVARVYIRHRLLCDVALTRCEELHRDLFARGIGTDAVEAYAVARDAFEDSVEAFGAAGRRLAALLGPALH